jgi:hypothetical protein
LAVLSAVGTWYQYFDKKKWERRWKEFEVYHRLIEIVNNVDGNMGLLLQRAAVYELEYFKRYYPLTLKILSAQKEEWSNKEEETSELCDDITTLINKIQKRK